MRRKHDLRQKKHIPLEISYRGKPDSVNVRCSCGYVDLVATWYIGHEMAKASGVRTLGEWHYMIVAITRYLQSIHPATSDFIAQGEV